MRYVRVSLAVLIISLLLPLASQAIILTGDSRTYLIGREASLSDEHFYPLYEYLNFDVENLKSNELSFHLGAWGRVDLSDDLYNRKTNGDLQYAFLSYRRDMGNTIINIGRVPVYEGVATEIVDGLYAKTDLKYGFGVSGFLGHPVETDNFIDRGDFLYGARIQHQVPNIYRAGISYLKETSDFREEETFDIWVHPVTMVEVTGNSTYNSQSSGWSEHDYRLTLGPYKDFTLGGGVQWIDYERFFDATTSAAFAFRNGIINPEEKVLIGSVDLAYTLYRKFVIIGDYKHFGYDIAGDANYYGGRFTYNVYKTSVVGAGYHRMDGHTESLKYNEFRAFVNEKFSGFDVTADFIWLNYDQEINDLKNAYSVSLSGGYSLMKNTKVEASVEYLRDPFFDKDFRGLLKFIYHFEIPSSGKNGGYKG